jgi:hypothetical protein
MEFSHQIRHTRVYDFESLQVARHCCRKICLPFGYVNHPEACGDITVPLILEIKVIVMLAIFIRR